MADTDDYHLGEVSARYESNGPGTVSTGTGDKGGVSYGTYQLSSNEGTLADYLKQSAYKSQFDGLSPGSAAFNNKWHELGKADPGFGHDQQNFIKRTHFDPVMATLQEDGLDLTDRGPAVREALWSTSVQMRGLTPRIFEHGLEDKFGKNYKLSDLSDKDIVGAVQDYKIAHTSTLFKSSPGLWQNLTNRAEKEKEDLVALADGKSLPERGNLRQAQGRHSSLLKQGMHGDNVRHAQDELHDLGYLQADPDGRFGPATKAAVERFQYDQGLDADAKIGPATQRYLDAAVRGKQIAGMVAATSPELRAFGDPDHPQNALYNILKNTLPPGTSEARLAQGTAVCYMTGIKKPDDLSGVYVGDNSVTFISNSFLALPAQMDISRPAPQVQQSMQQVQQHDQQQVQIQAQITTQIQAQNVQVQQGPVPGGGPGY